MEHAAARHPKYLWAGVTAAVCAVILAVAFWPTGRQARRHARVVAPAEAPREAAPPPATTAPVSPAVVKNSPFEADRTETTPAKGTKGGDSVNPRDVRKQVRSVVARWHDTLLHNDVDGYVSLYAPSVGPYFNKSRVSRSEIADEVHRVLGRYGSLTNYRISDLRVTPIDSTHAVATFLKKWDTSRNRFAGEELAQLGLEREGSDWAITSEKELKVYWVKRK